MPLHPINKRTYFEPALHRFTLIPPSVSTSDNLSTTIVGSLAPEHTFVTASTGIAASHLNGMTLHSFAGIGSGRADLERCIELASRSVVAAQWRKCRHLIIDEISMVDVEFFTKLEAVARFVADLLSVAINLFGFTWWHQWVSGRALGNGAEGPWFSTQLVCGTFLPRVLSVHPALNGYLTLVRAGEHESGEEEVWYLTSVTLLPVPVGSPMAFTFLFDYIYCIKGNIYE